MGLHLGRQGGYIVTACLSLSDAASYRSDIFVLNPNFNRVKAALVISAYWRQNNQKLVGVRRTNSKERVCGKHKRANVQRGSRLCGDPVCVQII